MRAAVFHGPHQDLTIEEVEVDEPAEREVLVRTAATGVCHSDLHFVEGAIRWPTPAVLGHEGAGVVEAVGASVDYVRPGDHVIVTGVVFCGSCDECLDGFPSRCLKRPRRPREAPPRLHQDGTPVSQLTNVASFAELMLVPENGVVRIEDDIPLDAACLVGCGVITGLGAVFHAAKLRPGQSAAVFGVGGVGLSVVQGARIAGARTIVAVDLVQSKLEVAREFGATHTIDASKEEEPGQAVQALTGGVNHAFEAIGLPATAREALLALRPGGTATIIGAFPRDAVLELPARLLTGDRVIQGVTMGRTRSRVDIPRYVDLYRQGRLKLDELISRRGRLEDINDAFAAMKAGRVSRSVLEFD